MFSRFSLSCRNFKASIIYPYRTIPFGQFSMVNSQKRLLTRKGYYQNNHQTSKTDSNLIIKRKRFGLSWLSLSALFIGSLIFWPVTLPFFAIGFATVITTGTIIFIGGWLFLAFAGVLVMGLALAVPALKVYYDFRRIEAKQDLVADWHVVDQPTSPWFGHRWAKPTGRTIEFQWFQQYTTIDQYGNVIVSKGLPFDNQSFLSRKIHDIQQHITRLGSNVGKVVEREAQRQSITSRKVWLERSWLYFFKFSICFNFDM
jgi:hypothetical protein